MRKLQLIRVNYVSATKIRLCFSWLLRKTVSTLSPLNYTISGPNAITIISVARYKHTYIDLTVSGLLPFRTYSVFVHYMQTREGYPMPFSRAYRTATATASNLPDPTAPRLSSISRYGVLYLTVVFNDYMLNNASLVSTTNYIISGPSVITVVYVARIAADQVRVKLSGEQVSGGTYTLTVSQVKDCAGNTIDPMHNYSTFSGQAFSIPTIAAISSVVDSLQVSFSKDISDVELTNQSSYVFTCPNTNFLRFLDKVYCSKTGGKIITGVSLGSSPLYISRDLGGHWGALYPDTGTMTYGPRCSQSANGSIIFLCAYQRRIYLSTDYGESFVEARPLGDTDQSWRYTCCDDDGSVLIATGFGANMFYISVNSGNTWNQITTIPTGTKFEPVCSADGSVIAVNVGTKLYVSTNTGSSWTDRTPSSMRDGFVTYSMAMSTDGSCIMYINDETTGDDTVRYTSNYGANWTTVLLPTGGAIQSQCAMSSDGQVLYVINGTCIYRSANAGSSWADKNIAAIITNPHQLACNATGTTVVVVDSTVSGTYNYLGNVYISENGGDTWTLKKPAYLTAKKITKIDSKTVTVEIAAEMTTGVANYTLTCDQLHDSTGNSLSPNYKSFNGVGTRPRVSSSVFTYPFTIQVNFDSKMLNNSALNNVANYAVTGLGSGSVTAVSCLATGTVTQITLTVVWDVEGEYTITLNNITDAAENTLENGYNTVSFEGSPTFRSHSTLSSGLLALYLFDNSSGDVTGVFNGTWLGSSTYTTGLVSQAAQLKEGVGYVSLGTSSSLTPSSISVGGFFYPAIFTGRTGLVQRFTGSDMSYCLNINNNSIGGVEPHISIDFEWRVQCAGGADSVVHTILYPYNPFVLALGTYDGTTIKLYTYDSELEAIHIVEKVHAFGGAILNQPAVEVKIGGQYPGATAQTITADLVGIWNRILNLAEVTDFFNENKGLVY